jgi:Arc/MetJ-type ribon-helix-helix transcriptional regulator
MAAAKIAITVDRELLKTVDRMVKDGRFASRSQAVQTALLGQLERWKRRRLAEESRKLNPKEERASADERLKGESWPAY